jgi:hypothetical protein
MTYRNIWKTVNAGHMVYYYRVLVKHAKTREEPQIENLRFRALHGSSRVLLIHIIIWLPVPRYFLSKEPRTEPELFFSLFRSRIRNRIRGSGSDSGYFVEPPGSTVGVLLRYLRGTFGVPIGYLWGTFTVPKRYRWGIYRVLLPYLRGTYGIPRGVILLNSHIKTCQCSPFGAKMWNSQNIWNIDKMNALSIVYEEERSLKKYCSRIPNSYWVMGLVCNEALSLTGRGSLSVMGACL